jgi:hypothetical protein
MSADPLQLLETLLQRDLPPEELTLQAALLLSHAAHADFAGLYIGNPDTHSLHTVHQHPELSLAFLAYLKHRTRSPTPLARTALTNTHATFVNNYRDHPDARHAAVRLGVHAAAYLPLGHHAGRTFIASILHVTPFPDLVHNSPWSEDKQRLVHTVTHRVQAALARSN